MSNDNYRDTLYTITKDGHRKWIYPHLVKGFFYYKRAIVAYALIVFYLALPWIKINGSQLVLIDLPARKFSFFGSVFWATDTIFLFLVLLTLAISMFFFTALFGRVWCGWACPETVFLEFVFRPIERLIAGGPVQRKKLDEQPYNLEKIKKKFLLHAIRACLAWIIASTALAYFVGRDPLLNMMTKSPTENLDLFILTVAMMGLMAFQFGWFREQFCTVVCPYARFQSVLLDRNSLVVGYDVKRGEPRGKAKQNQKDQEFGDCVDCGLCVRVCPTGIDIRNGLQLECINCTACIDACDSVMDKLGRPLGLIRYDSEASLLDGEKKKLGYRPFVYAGILVILLSIFGYQIANRSMTDFQVLRGGLDVAFSMINEETVTNHLHMRIGNKSNETVNYTIKVADAEVAALVPTPVIQIKPGDIITVPLFLNFNKSILISGKKLCEVQLWSSGNLISTKQITVLGPNE